MFLLVRKPACLPVCLSACLLSTCLGYPLPSARIQWEKILSELFVCFCIVRSFETEDFLETSHAVLFWLIKKRFFFCVCVLFFNLLCFWMPANLSVPQPHSSSSCSFVIQPVCLFARPLASLPACLLSFLLHACPSSLLCLSMCLAACLCD